MKIGIQTWGSDGDIRPFLALAGGLREAGHDVTLVISSVQNKEYHEYGKEMDYRVLHAGKILHGEEMEQILFEKSRTVRMPITQLKIVVEHFFDPLLPEMYDAAKMLCEENDIIIGHFLLHPTMLAAEKKGKPYITVMLNHGCLSSRHLLPIGCLNLGQSMNLLWWKLVSAVIDFTLLKTINQLRQKEGVAPVKELMKNVWASQELNLLTVSTALCEVQPDWSETNKITGFLNIPKKAENWEIPLDLKAFLEEGSPPVYITLGSMMDFDKEPSVVTEILVQGALRAGCRAIVQSCWDKLPDFPDHPNIFKVKSLPHQFVFPLCAAVVHHGGAGTSHSATLHGCPSIVIEHFVDQTLFAKELKRVGIAPRLLHRRNVSARKLGDAIREVIGSPGMKAKAEVLAKSMKKEDGVKSAVQAIEFHFSGEKVR